ncbi:MAG TPA: type II secretion system F family protein [candidate division Zixibacteria bacterium]|nr:type II secretion system F family protein [candidate division Zixibacteria bacterium]
MSLFLIALFTFLSAMSLIVILFMLPMAVQDTPQARIRRRLSSIGRMAHASKSEIQSLLKSSVYSDTPWLNELLGRFAIMRRIDLLLERANVDMTPMTFLMCSAGAFGVTFLMMAIVGKPFLLGLLFAVVAFFVPYAYLQYITWKRLRLFLEQMPDGLDMISQSLQAGLGLTQAMVYVAKEMPDPIGTEFSVFIEEVNLGLPLNDALRKFEERINLPEVRLFNTALLVQREVGGSLAELLTKLSNIIRDRFRIERLIKSITAQNRMSAWVVCSIPPFLAVFMFVREPVMMNEMLAHPVGRGMLAAALVLEVLGILVFRKLIKVHI